MVSLHGRAITPATRTLCHDLSKKRPIFDHFPRSEATVHKLVHQFFEDRLGEAREQ